MQKIRLTADDIDVGQPLPWSVYGASDELLLDNGRIVSTEKQKGILVSRGLYRNPTKLEQEQQEALNKKKAAFALDSPFKVLDVIKITLKQILLDMESSVESNYAHRVIRLATVVQKLCYENSDAALGAIILDQNSAYTNVHPVLCAMLSELMLRRQKIPSEDRLFYIAAALTQNIGMLSLQAQLTNQTEKLSDQQRQAIKEHPYRSKEIMQGLGIHYNEWLDTVSYHHERPDGKGYPNGLTGDSIPIYAKILSLTDIYSAMILPRKYRDGFYVKKALQDIFIQRGKSVDEACAMLLVKEMGIYPPGTFVKLANRDTAIVLRRGTKNADSPIVLSIIDPQGYYYDIPKKRETIHKDIFGITEVIPRLDDLQLNRDEIWGLA